MVEGSLLKFVVQVLRRHGWIVAICLLLSTAASVGHALMSPKRWQATQSLLVRDQLVGTSEQPGRFRSQEQMKSVEETIRTIANNPTLVKEALRQVGPPDDVSEPGWLSDEYVESVRDHLSVVAPNGAEFGHTEVLQLIVEASSPARAERLAESLTSRLMLEVARMQDERFRHIEDELNNEIAVAKSALQTSSRELKKLEMEIGEDLSELFGLTDAGSSDGPVRKLLMQTQQDLIVIRQHRGELETQLQYLELLANDPAQIVSTPATLLTMHPELGQLKEGMIDATLTLSDLRAKYADDHPRVQRTAKTRETLATELTQQLTQAVRGTQLERELVLSRQMELEKVEQELRKRSDHIARLRVPYSEALFRTNRHQERLTQLEKEQGAIVAARKSALQNSVISSIGSPQASVYPVTTSRTLIVVSGAAAGLILGIGMLAIVVDPREFSSSSRIETGSPSRSVAAAPADHSVLAGEIELPLSTPGATVPRGPAIAASPPANCPPVPQSHKDDALAPRKTEASPKASETVPQVTLPSRRPSTAQAVPETIRPTRTQGEAPKITPQRAGTNRQLPTADEAAEDSLPDQVAELRRVLQQERELALDRELQRYRNPKPELTAPQQRPREQDH